MIDPKDGVVEPEPKPWGYFEEEELFRPREWVRSVFVKVDGGALHLRDQCGKRQFNWWDGGVLESERFESCVPVTGYAENIEFRSD